MQDNSLQTALSEFVFEGEFAECSEIHTGHINRTYRADFRQADGSVRAYILQWINTYVLKNPEQVMENVLRVTEHLRAAMLEQGQNPEKRVLHCIPAHSGGVMFRDAEGNCWRAYDFIRDSISYDRVDSPDSFREIGRAFGEFQSMLSDFPIELLNETIPNFHDTKKRLEVFATSVAADRAGRADSVRQEIDFVLARRAAMGRIVDMLEDGSIPLRVTHNDTKINNVMLDAATGDALCVIDLDTVMAGSVLYDFGDAIRFGASTAAEDERDLSKIAVDMSLFESFADGFISQTASRLTLNEISHLPLGALVMTFEVGMRFLTDYLDGDVYFRVHYPEHNLIRARAQLKLLEDMESKCNQMEAVIQKMIEGYR